MIKRLTLPDWDELNTLYAYDNGELVCKMTGEIVSKASPSQPYKLVKVNGKSYCSHRLIFKLFHKKEPGPYIDHINQNKLDNRIENLREVTCAENAANTNVPRKTVLIDAQIPLIRACIDMGLTFDEVGSIFCVSRNTVRSIVKGHSWVQVS